MQTDSTIQESCVRAHADGAEWNRACTSGPEGTRNGCRSGSKHALELVGWRWSELGRSFGFPNTRIQAIELQLQIFLLSPAAPATSDFLFFRGLFICVHYLAESGAREVVPHEAPHVHSSRVAQEMPADNGRMRPLLNTCVYF